MFKRAQHNCALEGVNCPICVNFSRNIIYRVRAIIPLRFPITESRITHTHTKPDFQHARQEIIVSRQVFLRFSRNLKRFKRIPARVITLKHRWLHLFYGIFFVYDRKKGSLCQNFSPKGEKTTWKREKIVSNFLLREKPRRRFLSKSGFSD